MVQKFLDMDSTYRNRNAYPVGEFVVNISQGGQKNQLNAIDPITDAYPEIIFYPNEIICTDPVASQNGLKFTYTVQSGQLFLPIPLDASSATNKILLQYDYSVKSPLSQFALADDYFVGLSLVYSQGKTQLLRRIKKWKFLHDSANDKIQYFYADLDENITDFLTNTNTTFTIYNPSTINPSTSDAFFFLPASVPIDNYYVGYVIYNQNLPEYAIIDQYDGDLHIAHVNGINANWNLAVIYSVNKTAPKAGPLFGAAGLANFQFSVNLTSQADPSMINSFLHIFNPNINNQINEPIIVKKITAIIGKDKNNNYTLNIYDMVSFTTYVILENFDDIVNPINTYKYELCPYTSDSCVPFAYSGSMISNAQSNAQEITLTSLILPNVNLATGGKIWQYPYVFVELENISTSSSGNRNIIYSNNPNSYKAVFKVPVPNLSNPNEFQFINLISNNFYKQIINFKQNADVKLTIRLPNGKVFNTFQSDYSNGQYPNPFLQLSATFGMERV